MHEHLYIISHSIASLFSYRLEVRIQNAANGLAEPLTEETVNSN